MATKHRKGAVTHRNGRRARFWVLGILALSLVANLALAGKILIFDPNIRFRPVCLEKWEGFIALEGRTTKQFREAALLTPQFDWRVDPDGEVYLSRWNWWNHQDLFLTWSRTSAEAAYRQAHGARPDETKLLTHRCPFMRKWLLESRRQ